MERHKSIPERTRSRVFTGANIRSSVQSGGSDDNDRTFNLFGSTFVMSEGAADLRIIVFADRISSNGVLVPFVVETAGIPEGERAVRGVDYDLVTQSGAVITDSYFVLPAGQIRASVYVRAYTDDILEPTVSFRLRLVAQGGGVALPGFLGSNIEVNVSIVDATVPKVGFSLSGSEVLEPASGASVVVPIELTLSGPSSTDVTVSISYSSELGTLGTHYQVASDTVFIAEGETTGVFNVTIPGLYTFLGDFALTLQIGAIVGSAEVLVGSDIYLLSVIERDPNTTWTVRFSPVNGGTMVVREGDPAVRVAVEFAENIANSSPVFVDWAFEPADGSGLVLGQNITSSSPNPLVIQAGLPFTILNLQAPSNATIEGDREFRLVLTSVIGGGAQLSSVAGALEIAGTVADTTVPLPNLSWAYSTLVALEGATVSAFLVLSAPAPNPITVNILRSGAAGPLDLSYIGDSGSVVIPTGATTHLVQFHAEVDSVTEAGEEALFTLQATGSYNVVAGSTLSIIVRETVIGDTTLEFTPAPPGKLTLVDVTTGFDPISVGLTPALKINGVKADVFPIDVGRSSGEAVAWQAIAYLDGSSGLATLSADDGSASYGPGYRTDNIGDVEFFLQTLSTGMSDFLPHRVKISEGILVEVVRDGHYVRDEVYFLRPRLASQAGTKHEYCCQIMLFVTRRPDTIFVRLQFMNEGYDIDNGLGHFGNDALRHELDGRVFYRSLYMTKPSSLNLIHDPVHQRVTQGTNLHVASPTNRAHLIPPARMWRTDFALGRASASENAASTDHIFEGSGWAIAKDGDLAYWKRPWYSQGAKSLPLWGSAATYGGLTGRAAVLAASQALLDRVRLAGKSLQSLDSDFMRISTDIGGREYGWFEPGIIADSYSPGGAFINLQWGMMHNPIEMRAMTIMARSIAQCNPVGITDVNTGRQILNADLARTNVVFPGVPGSAPFVFEPLGGFADRRMPWFTPLSGRAGGSHTVLCKRPTDRQWNAVPASIEESLRIESIGAGVLDTDSPTSVEGSSGGNWGNCDLDHYVRVHEMMAALAWSRNCPWAKWMCRRDGINIERMVSEFPIQGVSALNSNLGFAVTAQQLHLIPAKVAAIGPGQPGGDSVHWGGYSSPWFYPFGGYGLNYNRGAGHLWEAVSCAAALTAVGDYDYANHRSWNQRWLLGLQLVTTNWGCADRNAVLMRDGVTGTSLYELTLPVRGEQIPEPYPGFNQLAWKNPVPLTSSGSENWQGSYMGARAYDAWKVFGEATSFSEYEKFITGMAFAITRVPPLGARTPTRSRGNQYNIYSTGLLGQGDPPSPNAPIEWPLLPAAGSNVPGIVNERIIPLYGSALQALHDLNRISERDELLGYLKIHFGLAQNASLAQLDATMQAQASNGFQNAASQWEVSLLVDTIGFVQRLARL